MFNTQNVPFIANLVVRAQMGDSDAFAELYAKTYNKVYNYACHYLKDSHLAQDAVQEVYIQALKNLTKLNDPTLFIAWLNQISFHTCYDMAKKNTAYSQNTDPEILELITDDSEDRNPEEQTLSQDEYSRLHLAIKELPIYEQQALVMRYFNDMKLEDIADALEISLSTVKRYVNSAKETLAAKLRE